MTTTPQAALLSRMDAYLSGNSCEATAIIKNARDLLAKLQATQEPVQAGELPDERAAFEQWASDNGEFPRAVARSGDVYHLMATQTYWLAWQARAALSARKPLTDGQSKPLPPNIGDYVLATKYSDGDPGDAWALGFYAGNVEDRHLVNDAAGLAIRLGGYRRVGRIPTEIGNWLWANRDNLERAPLKISLWGMYDWAYVNEMLAPGSCGVGMEVKP